MRPAPAHHARADPGAGDGLAPARALVSGRLDLARARSAPGRGGRGRGRDRRDERQVGAEHEGRHQLTTSVAIGHEPGRPASGRDRHDLHPPTAHIHAADNGAARDAAASAAIIRRRAHRVAAGSERVDDRARVGSAELRPGRSEKRGAKGRLRRPQRGRRPELLRLLEPALGVLRRLQRRLQLGVRGERRAQHREVELSAGLRPPDLVGV